MTAESPFVVVPVGVAAAVGNAYLVMGAVNFVYALPVSKAILRPVRAVAGLWVAGGPLALLVAWLAGSVTLADVWPVVTPLAVVGGVWFPVLSVIRGTRPKPPALVAEKTRTIDFRALLGDAVVGDGRMRQVAALKFNDLYRVDFTALTLAVPKLPAWWDGLTVLLLSDLHFHGTPSRAFFDAVFDEITREQPPDVVCLAGDYVDSDEHVAWIGPLLGRLTATHGKFAVLGNHDIKHHPDRIRAELAVAGYTVVGNGWVEATVRGEKVIVIGNEAPWIRPRPDLSTLPADGFRLCVSHSPDQFPWGVRGGVNLMLCGHVHGGQVRLPGVGSVFVPSVYGRRFDCGVFQIGESVLAVGRGLSGKEPIRFRCRPQVLRLTLTTR